MGRISTRLCFYNMTVNCEIHVGQYLSLCIYHFVCNVLSRSLAKSKFYRNRAFLLVFKSIIQNPHPGRPRATILIYFV